MLGDRVGSADERGEEKKVSWKEESGCRNDTRGALLAIQ
jgi:hypothetical protein